MRSGNHDHGVAKSRLPIIGGGSTGTHHVLLGKKQEISDLRFCGALAMYRQYSLSGARIC
jgi:hypothetical protein